jgi:hypothetical protein
MAVDYCNAADRHWEDAGHLLNNNRLANSDHLFGFAAECALKAIMMALGMSLDAHERPVEEPGKKHINELWNEFGAFVQSRGGAKYAAMIDTTLNPFDDWKAGQRYHHRSTFTVAKVEKHRQAAERTMGVLQDAILDGVIR